MRRHFSDNKRAVAVLEQQTTNYVVPWKEVKDPKGSSLTYWWNPETNETTPLGSPRPAVWVEVKDPQGSEMTYWWNPDTNQTTALGAPRPSSVPASYSQSLFTNPQPVSFGQSMKLYLLTGFGVSMGFILIRLLLG